jgi:hypothetical protein
MDPEYGCLKERETNLKSKCNSNFCILSSEMITNRLQSFEGETLGKAAKGVARVGSTWAQTSVGNLHFIISGTVVKGKSQDSRLSFSPSSEKPTHFRSLTFIPSRPSAPVFTILRFLGFLHALTLPSPPLSLPLFSPLFPSFFFLLHKGS